MRAHLPTNPGQPINVPVQEAIAGNSGPSILSQITDFRIVGRVRQARAIHLNYLRRFGTVRSYACRNHHRRRLTISALSPLLPATDTQLSHALLVSSIAPSATLEDKIVDPMTPELDSLPDEVVQCILNFSHPQAAVSLGRTSRRFTGVANEPLLWQHYCLTTYQYWDSRHDIRRKFAVVDSTDWKELFAERHAIDRKTTDIVNAMIFDQTKRMEKIRVITTFGYDAKDILLRHMRMGEDVEDYLARR